MRSRSEIVRDLRSGSAWTMTGAAREAADMLEEQAARIERLDEIVREWIAGTQHHAARAAEKREP
jgi:galactokinase/mevalonate kinase-like predicted kinase